MCSISIMRDAYTYTAVARLENRQCERRAHETGAFFARLQGVCGAAFCVYTLSLSVLCVLFHPHFLWFSFRERERETLLQYQLSVNCVESLLGNTCMFLYYTLF